MRTICIVATAALLVGCALSSQSTYSALENGIYRICSNDESGKTIRITTKTARTITVHVQESTDYLPQKIVSFSAGPAENCWHVQIEGIARGTNWAQEPFLVVAAGKPYYEIAKTGSATSNTTNQVKLPAILSFKVPDAAEANSVTSALRHRFSIK